MTAIRSTILSVTRLDERLVPNSQAAVIDANGISSLVSAVEIGSYTPVGLTSTGEMIYTNSAEPQFCNCAACRAARAKMAQHAEQTASEASAIPGTNPLAVQKLRQDRDSAFYLVPMLNEQPSSLPSANEMASSSLTEHSLTDSETTIRATAIERNSMKPNSLPTHARFQNLLSTQGSEASCSWESLDVEHRA